MRVAVICNDTRGGVQPYVALARGLRAAGHDVRAVAPVDLAPMFAAEAIAVTGLSGTEDVAQILASTGAAERGMLATVHLAARELPSRIAVWMRETLNACDGADVLTGGIGGMGMGLSIADRLGVPFVETHLQPVGAPTGRYPGVLFPGIPRWLGGPGRRLSHHLTELALWAPMLPAVRRARRQVLGLHGRATSADGMPVLYGFSRHVVDVPAGESRPRHVVGYWSLPVADSWSPPAALTDFLDGGDPVIGIGFGSMASADPAAVTDLVAGAVRDAGVRAVLLSGWGGLRPTREGDQDLLFADALPHDWLYPRMAAVVHHGGAGTTGAALRAGVPAVVVPFTMDQPFWASRVAELGAGPAPIPRARLSRQRLADALRKAVGDKAMRERAASLGERIRAEDGVAAAVRHFDRLS